MHALQSGLVLGLTLVLEITVLHPYDAALIASTVDCSHVLIAYPDICVHEINMLGNLSG